MTTELTKAAQQALEAFDAFADADDFPTCFELTKKMNALRHALTQRPAAQEVGEREGWTDADADAARLAMELECLLLDTKDTASVSRWWASANEALDLHRARLAAPQQATPALQAVCRYISDVLAGDASSGEKHIARTIMHLLPLEQAVSGQQATPEPVGEQISRAEAIRLINALIEGDTLPPVSLDLLRELTRPAPGVPGDSELLDYLDTLATRAAGSDLHCFGGRVVLYVRTGIGSQIEASGAGTAREAIRAALAAAQAKGAGHE